MNNGKICVSVCAKTAGEFVEKIKRAAALADVVELRFDCLNPVETRFLLSEAARRAQTGNVRFVITFRPSEQGGSRALTKEERENFWRNGQDAFWGGDFEEDAINDFWFWRCENRIGSYHNFSETPENLGEIFGRLAATKADIVKIAVQATDATDGLAVMQLLERAKAENKELIPIAMGEHGVWTRILGLSRGAAMTFASLSENSQTAPGQLTAWEMSNVYRVKELDRNTAIYGLIAGSTAHSVSPHVHNAAFKSHAQNAVYVPFAVQNLSEFMRRMVNSATREIDLNLRGFSVTLPHKVEIIKYLDETDETAKKIGAVNTVKIDNGKLLGFNTDAAGFIEPLKNSYGNLQNARVAVLGAGGAARAVVYALQQENANVTVFARSPEKAASLQNDFDVELKSMIGDQSQIFDYNVVVNATPLGMRKGGLETQTPATAEQLKNAGLVYDLVYNPFQTKLMKEADKVFVPTIGGLAMLVAQAMEQQKIWTGLDAPMKEMSRAALRKLES